MQEANFVGIFDGERISKTVESVFMKFVVTNYFGKAVYESRIVSGHYSHTPISWLMPS